MAKLLQTGSLLLILFLWLGIKEQVKGQVSITAANLPYQENFDGMGATGTTYPAGWTAFRYAGSGTVGQTLTPGVTDGSASTGNVYNVGTLSAPERALGSLASGSTAIRLGAGFQNNTGQTVTAIDFAGVMEQWRSGSSATIERDIFEYSLNATGIQDATATWTALPAMDLLEKLTATTSAGAVDGNLDIHKTSLSGNIAGLAFISGTTIWIRWSDSDASGSDGMLALDDFSITLNGLADNTAPVLAAGPFVPADEAANVPITTNTISVTFNENIRAGTGNIILSNLTDGTSQLLDVANPGQVSFSGATATLSVILAAGKDYGVQIPATAITDISGNAFAGFTGNTTWNFSTPAAGTPVIQVNPAALAFGGVAPQSGSASLSFILTATDLSGNVDLSTAAPFLISKNNVDFGLALSFTPAELDLSQTVYVRFNPVAEGPAGGVVTITSPGAAAGQVALSGEGSNPYHQDFASCQGNLSGGWTAYSVSGAQQWACTGFGRSNNGVQANGFAGTNNANEDWLISPALNLAGFDVPLLSFWSRSRFAGSPLQLMVSTNYSGTGDPHAAGVTWVEVAAPFAPVNSDVWKQTRDIDLTAFKQAQVIVAFVYTSTATSGSRWTLDDFAITDSPIGPFQTSLQALSDLDFGTVIAPDESAARTFTFSASALDNDLTLLAPAEFVLSKDNLLFTGSLSYTPAQAGSPNTVYLKFKPGTTGKAVYTGTIRFTSGSDLDTTAGYVSGNTVPGSETLDVVNWNIEWFGAANGPGDNALQLENASKVLASLDAEIYVLQEISNQQAFQDLVSRMPGYKGFSSPYISSGSGLNAQRLAFIYKTSAIDSVGGRGLLTGAGQAGNFWASGRLPYMFIFDAQVNGVKKRVHLINIHPKANENGSTAEAQDAYNRRKFDVQILKDTLDQYYANANIILAGDYNDDIDFTVAAITSTTESSFKAFTDDAARYKPVTLPLSQAGLRTYITAENVIDHVLISNELVDDYLDRSARIDIPFEVVADYGNTTSDHLPVVSRFRLVPEVGFALGAETAGENAGTKTITLTLAAASPVEQTLTIGLKSGATAVYGPDGDFVTTPDAAAGRFVLTIPAHSTSVDFTALIRENGVAEPDKQVTFEMLNSLTGLGLDLSRKEYTLTIADNDKTPQTITFDALTGKMAGEAPFTLSATATSGLPVSFSVESGPASVSGNTVTLTGAGQVTIRASQAGNATYGAAADVVRTFCVHPAKPSIVVGADGSTLTSSVSTGNQWYRNGEVITGATGPVYQALQGGLYTVVVTAGTCPSAPSDPALVVITGQKEPALQAGFKVFPNPATAFFWVSLAKAGAGQSVIALYDLGGRLVFRQVVASKDKNLETLIPAGDLPRNTYILLITAPKGVVWHRVILK